MLAILMEAWLHAHAWLRSAWLTTGIHLLSSSGRYQLMLEDLLLNSLLLSRRKRVEVVWDM